MSNIKLEAIISWTLITIAIAVAIWLIIGSPPADNGLLMIIIFVATSEILIWKALFAINNKTQLGFMKIKNDISNLSTGQGEIKSALNNIKELIRRKR